MFSAKDIEMDSTFQKLLRKKKGLSPHTIENYVYAMKSFSDFTGKSPTEIHDLHKNDLKNHVPEFDMWLTDALEDWVADQIESRYTYRGIQHRLVKIKSFLHIFRLKPTPQIDIHKNNVKEDSKYSLTVEDIRKAITYSNPTYKAIFITQSQTGLAISDTLLLDVDDFIKAVSNKNESLTIKEAIYRVKNDDNIIGCFDLRRKKTNNEFYTFIGHEGLKAIATLLELRKPEYNVPEAPIFIKEISRLQQKPSGVIEELRLIPRAVKSYVLRMHERGIFPKIKVDGKTRNYFRTHKLRKWYSNQLRFKARFSAEDTKYLMGQTTGDVLERYIDVNNYNALKSNYRKALPYLAINEEIKLEENKEAIESLSHELQKYKKESKARDEEMSDMQSEIINLKKLLNNEDFAKDRI